MRQDFKVISGSSDFISKNYFLAVNAKLTQIAYVSRLFFKHKLFGVTLFADVEFAESSTQSSQWESKACCADQ
jgi:hypothetical protein